MINYKKLIQPLIIIILLIIIFLQRSCYSDNIKYKTKLVKQFDTIYKPSEIKTKIITKYKNLKGNIVYLPGKVDTVEVKIFEKAPDPVKITMFADATKIRQYKNDFNDSIADVSIFTETKGELLKISPKITIKARLPEKKTVFAIYGGGGLYLYNLENLNYKFNLRFQNKRGDLFSGSYDPITKTGFIDYDLRFINIKK
jgi:hypothetical protein